MTFKVEIVYNFPIILIQEFNNINALVDNKFIFNYKYSDYFTDPENEPYYAYFRSKDVDVLPYFITRNYTNGTFEGFVTEADIGNY